MNIRPYQPEDAPQIERCIAELQEYERGLEPSRVEGTADFARQSLQRMLQSCQERQGQIFVADAEGVVAGFTCVWLVHGQSPISTTNNYAYIAELEVLPEHRRQGIGRALLMAAETYAVHQGMRTVRIEVLAANSGARALYHEIGFREFELLLRKELPHDMNE